MATITGIRISPYIFDILVKTKPIYNVNLPSQAKIEASPDVQLKCHGKINEY